MHEAKPKIPHDLNFAVPFVRNILAESNEVGFLGLACTQTPKIPFYTLILQDEKVYDNPPSMFKDRIGSDFRLEIFKLYKRIFNRGQHDEFKTISLGVEAPLGTIFNFLFCIFNPGYNPIVEDYFIKNGLGHTQIRERAKQLYERMGAPTISSRRNNELDGITKPEQISVIRSLGQLGLLYHDLYDLAGRLGNLGLRLSGSTLPDEDTFTGLASMLKADPPIVDRKYFPLHQSLY